MDIRELDKKQLVLLTLLITFVVSIATGIVTVSLMNQMPKSVPQTINNVIQRTIEKVTTIQVPAPVSDITADNVTSPNDNSILLPSNSDALISIYIKNIDTTAPPSVDTSNITTDANGSIDSNNEVAVGQGIIVSDVGLILVDSSLIKEQELYKIVLNKIDFDVFVLKKFDNGFTILKISPMTNSTPDITNTSN